MTHHAGIAGLLFAFMATTVAEAATEQAVNAKPLSISQAITLALEHNQEIANANYQVSAAQAGVQGAEGHYDTTLFGSDKYAAYTHLTADDYPVAMNYAKDYNRADAGVRQRFNTGSVLSMYYTNERTGKISAPNYSDKPSHLDYVTFELTQSLLKGLGDKEGRGAIEKAKLAAQNSREGYVASTNQFVANLIQEYWVLCLAKQNVKAADSSYQMAKELLQRDKKRLASGLAQESDISRAEAAMLARQYTLDQYKRDVLVMEDRIKQLLNTPDLPQGEEVRIAPTDKPQSQAMGVPATKQAVDTALAQRSEIRQVKNMLTQAGIEIGIAENNTLPTLDLSLGYRVNGSTDELENADNYSRVKGKDGLEAGLSFSYPIQNNTAESALSQAQIQRQIANELVSKTEGAVRNDVLQALHNLDLAEAAIPTTRQAYEASQQTVKGELQRFELMQVSNRDLLAAQDTLTRDELTYNKAVVDYNIARAQYQAAIGALLNDYHVDVESLLAKRKQGLPLE